MCSKCNILQADQRRHLVTLTLVKDKTPLQREATRSFRDLQIQWNINAAEHFKLVTENDLDILEWFVRIM